MLSGLIPEQQLRQERLLLSERSALVEGLPRLRGFLGHERQC